MKLLKKSDLESLTIKRIEGDTYRSDIYVDAVFNSVFVYTEDGRKLQIWAESEGGGLYVEEVSEG
jgi:hypothetical protein